MRSFLEILSQDVEDAFSELGWTLPSETESVVPAGNPAFGDYQCNLAMPLAKELSRSPRSIAGELVSALNVEVATVEIAGPGFINFTLKESYLIDALNGMLADGRLGLPSASNAKRIVVDFSGPNLAKEMHVGHLRSTIIGDAIARFLEFEGHDVLRINHVGDWGTQFGMLLQHLEGTCPDALSAPETFEVADLESFYRAARKRFDADSSFADECRLKVVALQSGDPGALALWRAFCHESLKHADQIYELLDIAITTQGESSYNTELPAIVSDLKTSGLATESEGAVCVFLDGHKSPLIVQKSDGGYKYETTDLAAIKHRIGDLKSDQVIYVTDARQKQHFAMVFEVATQMGWAPEGTLQHFPFGTMLDENGKPKQTRAGENEKLRDLIAEAESKTKAVAQELTPALTPEELDTVGEVVGRGTIKYADLIHSPETDYKFDWDKMLALDGNTAVYMEYCYARTQSLAKNAGGEPDNMIISLETKQEITLARSLLQTLDVWPEVVSSLAPNILLQHLYRIAREYSSFWNACPVLNASPAQRQSRLALSRLTALTIQWGLSLVGIGTVDKL